jgi:hypothetical protein
LALETSSARLVLGLSSGACSQAVARIKASERKIMALPCFIITLFLLNKPKNETIFQLIYEKAK